MPYTQFRKRPLIVFPHTIRHLNESNLSHYYKLILVNQTTKEQILVIIIMDNYKLDTLMCHHVCAKKHCKAQELDTEMESADKDKIKNCGGCNSTRKHFTFTKKCTHHI